MKKRGVFLIAVLILRLVVGGIMTVKIKKGVPVRIEGEVDKTYQKGSKCIVGMGVFRVEMEGGCEFSRRDKVGVTGTIEQGVTDWLMGRVWLKDEGKVELLESGVREEGWWWKLRGKLENKREKLSLILVRLLPQKEAGLVAGIVLGEKMRLGKEFYEQLIETGTVHIVVASGYNVMVVGGMVMEMGVWLINRTVMVWVAVGAMLTYALMAGGDPPVMRAVIMGGILLIGKAWGRRGKSGWGLAWAVWAMVMVRPEIVEEVSFQLSVAASLGLMVVEPKLRRWLEKLKLNEGWKWMLRTELLPTIAAQMTTAPIIWWYFGRVSWIAPLVNVLVLPLVPILMAWGGLMLLLGLVWLPLGKIVGWWVYGLAGVMVKLIEIW